MESLVHAPMFASLVSVEIGSKPELAATFVAVIWPRVGFLVATIRRRKYLAM